MKSILEEFAYGNISPEAHPNGKIYNKCPSDIYTCSTYSLTSRWFDSQCTAHNIRTVVIRELALEAIRVVSGFVKSNEAEFIRQVRESSAVRQEQTAKAHRRRIAREQKHVAEYIPVTSQAYCSEGCRAAGQRRADRLRKRNRRKNRG